MYKLILRVFINFFQKIINFDNLSYKYPVSVKGLIIENDKILLLQNERNEWDLPGGKIFEDEDIHSALVREVFEETNLNVKIINFVDIKNIKINEVQVIVIFFILKVKDSNPIKTSFEHTNYNFLDFKAVNKSNINKDFKKVIKKII